jgi:predicted GTPase
MLERVLKQGLDRLRQSGLTETQVADAEEEIRARSLAEPDPRIALIGFTGVGKSSTINALFNSGRPIGHVRACTQEAAEVRGDVTEFVGARGSVVVYDMPGLGEDIKADEQHLTTYASVLPRVDVAVWTFHAGDRAMTPMQHALITLQRQLGSDFTSKLMFAVNKADATAPGESAWIERANIPSLEQRQNIADFESYVLEKIHQVLPTWKGSIVTYSARRKYRLDQLMFSMVEAAGSDRRWLLDQRADVADYRDELDPTLLNFIEQNRESIGPVGERPWRERRGNGKDNYHN